jgi:hypothetical protein
MSWDLEAEIAFNHIVVQILSSQGHKSCLQTDVKILLLKEEGAENKHFT